MKTRTISKLLTVATTQALQHEHLLHFDGYKYYKRWLKHAKINIFQSVIHGTRKH